MPLALWIAVLGRRSRAFCARHRKGFDLEGLRGLAGVRGSFPVVLNSLNLSLGVNFCPLRQQSLQVSKVCRWAFLAGVGGELAVWEAAMVAAFQTRCAFYLELARVEGQDSMFPQGGGAEFCCIPRKHRL